MDELKLSHPKTTVLVLIVTMLAGAFFAKWATKHLDDPVHPVPTVVHEPVQNEQSFVAQRPAINSQNVLEPVSNGSLDSDQCNKEVQEAATYLLSLRNPLPQFEEEQLPEDSTADSPELLLTASPVFGNPESTSVFRNVSLSDNNKEKEEVDQDVDENDDDEEISSIFQLFSEVVLADLLNGGILGDSEEVVFVMGDDDEADEDEVGSGANNTNEFIEKLVRSLGDPVPETGDDLFATEPEPINRRDETDTVEQVTVSAVETPIQGEWRQDEFVHAPRQSECWIVCSSPGFCFADDPMNWQLFQAMGNYWQATTGEAFFCGNDPTIPTIVYVHGNLADMDSTIQAGNYLVNRFRLLSGDAPFRLVLWKWGSEKALTGVRKDAQYKASLADADGRHLANFLAQLTGNVTLIGFSFGARNIGAALQQLACEGADFSGECGVNGATWKNYDTNPMQPMINPKYNVFFVGGATDESDFYQCGRFAQSVSLINLFVNVYNPQDNVLRFYPHLYNWGGNKAIGVTPLYATLLSPVFSGEALAINCGNIGREHNFVKYMQSIPPALLQRTLNPVLSNRQ